MFTANLNNKSLIMLKQILNLKGAQQLSKNEQQSINGGGYDCNGAPGVHCTDGYCCGSCTGPMGTCLTWG